ncbi:MAG: PAS domain S-box protein [Deltaproteobacteria bacterium]|nr:PAS domain S-box protein [Deltaproteobacteria bacterium]
MAQTFLLNLKNADTNQRDRAMTKAKILVVEDDSIVAEDIKNSLKKLGYDVSAIVVYGEQSLEKAKECQADLVLMDIMLKGKMDGTEAAELIQTQLDIPIVYLTAFTDENVLNRAKVTEPFGYVIKPFENRELNTAIEIALYKHRIEKKLRQSEACLSTTLKSIGDAVIATDTKGYIVFMNSVAQSLTGWNEDEAVGKLLTDVFNTKNDETREQVENNVDTVIGKSTITSLANSTILIAKDGKEIPIDENEASIRDEEGNITGVVMVFRDITRRKKAEETLKASQYQLDSIIRTVPDIIYRLDTEGKITYISDSIKKYGYQPEELWGQKIFNIVYPPDVEKVMYKMKERHTGDRNVDLFETRLLTKKNKVVPFEIYSITATGIHLPNSDITENFIGTQGVARDITEKKRADEEREKIIKELREAIGQIKTLGGLIPICSECSKIRNDDGYWEQIETFISEHSGASFSHGICPVCMDKLYGGEEWYEKEK